MLLAQTSIDYGQLAAESITSGVLSYAPRRIDEEARRLLNKAENARTNSFSNSCIFFEAIW